MPEGVGMDVGKIIFPTEVMQPICDAVRMHGRNIIPNKTSAMACAAAICRGSPLVAAVMVLAATLADEF